MYDLEVGRFLGRDPLKTLPNLTNECDSQFARKNGLDPGGDDWFWPWGPRAEWWFPFNEEGLQRFAILMNPLCLVVQSDEMSCRCCAIETADLSAALAALLIFEIPYADWMLNLLDCGCDGNDTLNATCTVWNDTASIPHALGINAIATSAACGTSSTILKSGYL
jgi:hypothetical protein